MRLQYFAVTVCFGLFTFPVLAGQIVPPALVPFIPPGLGPGDSFHLTFVTSTFTDATDPTTTAYDKLVNSAADSVGVGPTSPGGIRWNPMVATFDFPDAGVTAPVSAPIFRLADGVVVDTQSLNTFYNNGFLVAQNNLTESGVVLENETVWTGVRTDDHPAWHGGAFLLGGAGSTLRGSTYHIGINSLGAFSDSADALHHVYALSPELTVVPEPGTSALLGVLCVCLGGYVWRKRRRVA